jgi:hypothetical protein
MWDYEPSTYTGAPDECSIHWPTKLVDGKCPVKGCPWNGLDKPRHHRNRKLMWK